MVDDGTYTATLDRIEEGIAVLLLEDDGEVLSETHVHDLDRLPDDGRHEGAILFVSVDDGDLVTIEYDGETEQRRRERLQDRFDSLSERPPSRDSDS